MSDWMQTYTGRKFYPLDPAPHHVDLIDIAHALSLTCRFNGHCFFHYSVAQHCVLASQLDVVHHDSDARWVLMHDAAEAYIGDMVRPIKHTKFAEDFRMAEEKIMRAICRRFSMSIFEPDVVKQADLIMLATEKRDVMSSEPSPWDIDEITPSSYIIQRWTPEQAESEFLMRAQTLGIE